ncbi:MAG: hypothetical protein DRR19_27735 [Candidatus Parabeggiatoa sp. nov. 1]|nr:MAG: hypothetical protein DRR19_27735 [Gammaproteobacteria bacterium]
MYIETWLRKVLVFTGLDRAVMFSVLARIWGPAAGIVTMLLIATIFSQQLQGYYYTFNSVLALQVFAEMGLSVVIVQFASHEWAKLSLDNNGTIVGDADALSRLISLARFAIRWYLIAGIATSILLGIAGYLLFNESEKSSSIEWLMPWLALCLVTGLTLTVMPILSLLEGCHQISQVYYFRLIQAVVTAISVWVAVSTGAELWTAAIGSLMGLTSLLILVYWYYRDFLTKLIFSHPMSNAQIEWRSEVLPMQWRIAVSWMSGYFVFSLFTPVLFHYHGAVVAGQMGMTWSLIAGLSSIPSAWLNPKMPQFGLLIARSQYDKLDNLFWRITITVIGLVSVGALVIWSLVYVINDLGHEFAMRILPPQTTAFFLLATVIVVSSFPMAAYLRAHKKEPLLLPSLLSAILIALSTLILGKFYAAEGMAIGYLTVNAIIIPIVILIWYRCKTEWHSKDRLKNKIMRIKG